MKQNNQATTEKRPLKSLELLQVQHTKQEKQTDQTLQKATLISYLLS